MNAEIVAIGSELLLGTTMDTNSAYLARQLTMLGITMLRCTIVDDDMARIVAAIGEARQRADIVVCTGGLGPTVDDRTRKAVAQATGRPLEFRQELLDQIAARFAAMKRTMSESNRQQAYVPQGARAIENPRGTAPSFIVEDECGILIVLPGVPLEMRFIVEQSIIPYLRNTYEIRDVIYMRTLHVVGLGESLIGECIADLMRLENPIIGTSAKQGRCELRIRVVAESNEVAEMLLAPIEAEIQTRLAGHLVAEPLHQLVPRLLTERNLSLAISEANYAAPIFRALSNTPDGFQPIAGMIIDKPAGKISPEYAATLALDNAMSVREQWGADLGLAMLPVQTDSTAFTTVHIALVSSQETKQVSQDYDLHQLESWEYVSNLALDMVRRVVETRSYSL